MVRSWQPDFQFFAKWNQRWKKSSWCISHKWGKPGMRASMYIHSSFIKCKTLQPCSPRIEEFINTFFFNHIFLAATPLKLQTMVQNEIQTFVVYRIFFVHYYEKHLLSSSKEEARFLLLWKAVAFKQILPTTGRKSKLYWFNWNIFWKCVCTLSPEGFRALWLPNFSLPAFSWISRLWKLNRKSPPKHSSCCGHLQGGGKSWAALLSPFVCQLLAKLKDCFPDPHDILVGLGQGRSLYKAPPCPEDF